MAAAYQALVSLMNTIEQAKDRPLLFTSLQKEWVQSAGQRVEFLVDFIEKYGSHEGINDLEMRIVSAAYEAEDVIEAHIADQIRADERSGSIFLADLQKLIDEMDCIKEETIKVKEERGSIKDEQQPAACSTPAAAATSWRAHQTKMVGFDEESRQLMEALIRAESCRQIISVIGMGGAGKSTLVRNVYAKFITAGHFDVCAWASVTQDYSVRGILIELLKSFKQKPTSESVEELKVMLHKFLFSRRYLIVLDNVWSAEVWNEIQLYFPENNDCSRIVLTTRLVDVANRCNSYCLIRMNLLDEYKSWILFRETVFEREDCPPELKEVGKEISQQCKGLPLSIVVVGGFLRRSNKTVESWNNVANNIKRVLWSDEDVDCYKILSLSYIQLDVHLKPCLVCMRDFPAGFPIRASRIFEVWIAEGLIKPNRVQTLEKVAEGYLYELVDSNLILAHKNLYDGKITFLVHDLIRDVCLEKSQGFFCVGRSLDIKREPRIIYHDFMPSDFSLKIPVKLELFISIIRLNVQRLLCKTLPLRVVLELMSMVDSSLESISKNSNVKLLSYRLSDIYKPIVLIPSSVSLKIWNVQTLLIRTNYQILDSLFLVVAPREIWNLQQLRHVVCTGIYIPDPPPDIVLENLRTLIEVVNLRLSEEVCRRIPNVSKLYVEYNSNVLGFDYRWPDDLHNVGSLHKLSSLKLIGNLNESSLRGGWRKCTFPTSLKKLKLIACHIDWNDLMRISSLPHLEVLKLDSSMKGENWSPVAEEFGALKVLSIIKCDLRCWNADRSHFPVLKELFLEGLSHLEEIPSDIGEIPTLELIHVYKCSKSARISVEKIKEEQLEQGNEGLRIQISTPLSPNRTFWFPYSSFISDYRNYILGGYCLFFVFLFYLIDYIYLSRPYSSKLLAFGILYPFLVIGCLISLF